MLSKLIKLFPLETILRAGVMLLLSNKSLILSTVEVWIKQAQISIAGGPAKFEFVKVRVLDLLQQKSSFLLDTGIQMLVAWVKLKNPALASLPIDSRPAAMETALR